MTKMSIFAICFFLPLIKDPKLPKLLKTFVQYMVKAPSVREWHRNGFCISLRGTFKLSDYPCSSRPMQLEEKQLNDLIHKDLCQTMRELAQKMGCSHDTIAHHLYSLGKVQKLGAWVPHVLDKNHKLQ